MTAPVDKTHIGRDRATQFATTATSDDHFRWWYRQSPVMARVKQKGNDGNPNSSNARAPRDTSDTALSRSNKVSRVCGIYGGCANLVTSSTPIRPGLKNVTLSIQQFVGLVLQLLL